MSDEMLLVIYRAGVGTYEPGDVIPVYENGRTMFYVVVSMERDGDTVAFHVRPI